MRGGDAGGAQGADPVAASRRDLVVGIVGLGFVAAAVALVWGARGRADLGGLEPRTWPLVVLLGMAAAAGACVVKGLRRSAPAADLAMVRPHWPPLVATLALVAAYGFLWHYLHFLTVTPLLVVALGWLLGLRNLLALVLFAAGLSALVYLLFAVGFGISL